MRHRFLTLILIGLAFFLPSCSSDEKPVDTGVVAVAPGPENVEFNATLVPNSDLSPQEWIAQPSNPYNYQMIDETGPVDGNNIYTLYDRESRFGFTNLTGLSGPTVVTAIELNMNVDYDLHPDEVVYLYVRLYAGGVQVGADVFTWCTDDEDPSCGERDAEMHWEFLLGGLSLSISQANSLEVEVESWFDYSHGSGFSHAVHIENIYANVTGSTGGGGKDPDPNQQ